MSLLFGQGFEVGEVSKREMQVWSKTIGDYILVDGKWHYIEIVIFEGERADIYIDGEK